MGAAASKSSQPAPMAKASRAGVMPPCRCLPEEIVILEILVRLPPKSLLRCRAVCRAWRRATSARDFLLDHHGRQPSLPIVMGELIYGPKYGGARYKDFFAFDHRATDAQLQPVARLDQSYRPEAFCDGLIILLKMNYSTSFSIYNPATRKVGCYVFVLGSNQPPRYLPGTEVAAWLHFRTPALVRDNLHWFPVQHHSESRPVIAFDTAAESFRQMRAPLVPTESFIFEMDETLGIYSYNDAMKVVYIWVLQNYEGEVWEYKYRVELPVAEIRRHFGRREGSWHVTVVTADGDVLLLLSHCGWLFNINIDGKLVESFHRDGQQLSACPFRLKQSLVPHTFFTH